MAINAWEKRINKLLCFSTNFRFSFTACACKIECITLATVTLCIVVYPICSLSCLSSWTHLQLISILAMKSSSFCLCKNHFSSIQCRPKMIVFCWIVVNLGHRIRTWTRYASICPSNSLMQILVQLLWGFIVLTTKKKMPTTTAAKLQTNCLVNTSISTPKYLLMCK